MSTSTRATRGLYWRLSAVFVGLLLVFTAISIFIFTKASYEHAAELNQGLNRDLAAHTVKEIAPFIDQGKVNQEGMGDLMHSMMVINPNVEVYILDNAGKIISYMAPDKVVELEEVDMEPIRCFMDESHEAAIIRGSDPRNPDETKIFSAAPIIEDGKQTGFVYIVLASQKYISAQEQLQGSYILGVSLRSILVVLGLSLITGLFAFWFITKQLDRIVASMRRFKAGQLDTRIAAQGGEEFKLIAETFNSMAESLEGNIEELKGLDKLRKELISNISHDLRTPISSIQGYAETLQLKGSELDRETKTEFLNTITKNTKRLSVLVDGLFELSKLESGQVDLVSEEFSITELIHDVASKYRIISQKKGVSINTFLEKNSSPVVADISMIDRVLQNLIDNAIKFCSEGDYINIELDLSSPKEVKVSIADSGEGIPREQLDKIFDRYYKGRSDMNKEGTGLGLSIAQKIIQLHGGEMAVESTYQVGSTFSFTLPVAA